MKLRAIILVTVLAAGTLGCCKSQLPVNTEEEEAQIRAIMEQVNTAWETEDLEAFSQLVAHDDKMVSFGSDINDRWVGWDALEAGLRQQFEIFSDTVVNPSELDVGVSCTEQVAWAAQAMEISTKFMGSPVTLDARFTAVFEKREAGWQMVQFHYSVPISASLALQM